MSAWLNGKVDQDGRGVCPRCGDPSSETSVLCERHRVKAAANQSRWSSRHRPARRARERCAFCEAPSSTYRCEICAAKRRRWDAGQAVNDLRPATPEPAQQELDLGAPPPLELASGPGAEPDEES